MHDTPQQEGDLWAGLRILFPCEKREGMTQAVIRVSTPERREGLVAHKLNRPALFSIHLPIPGDLSHPGLIDSFVNLGNLSLTRNTVTSLALFIEKAKRIASPWRVQHVLFLKVRVENCSARFRFIDNSGVRCTACDREGKRGKDQELAPQMQFLASRPFVHVTGRSMHA